MKPSAAALLTVALSLLLLAGCASTDYYPYSGIQKEWPTGDSSFTKEVKGVQFIQGLPSKPYTILGKFQFLEDVHEADTQLARFAKRYHADAVLIGEIDQYVAGSVGTGTTGTIISTGPNTAISTGTSFVVPVEKRSISGYLIKFK